ncbi:MAG: hypothetical protein MUF69_04160 [Desulfobacterota bacterium]|jgi:hypothetical protein|nr:hypothetical protein [Thermodesulfobacteriota bacterium]
MNPVSNYIIRIYRCEKDRPKSLVGIVEEAGEKGKKAFQSYDELWEILNTGKGKRKTEITRQDIGA